LEIHFSKPLKLKKFSPEKIMTEPVVITEETVINPGPPEFEESVKAMNQLREDPKFMVTIHERQLERITMVIEEMAQRILNLEEKINEIELAARFPHTDSPIPNLPDGPGRLKTK